MPALNNKEHIVKLSALNHCPHFFFFFFCGVGLGFVPHSVVLRIYFCSALQCGLWDDVMPGIELVSVVCARQTPYLLYYYSGLPHFFLKQNSFEIIIAIDLLKTSQATCFPCIRYTLNTKIYHLRAIDIVQYIFTSSVLYKMFKCGICFEEKVLPLHVPGLHFRMGPYSAYQITFIQFSLLSQKITLLLSNC